MSGYPTGVRETTDLVARAQGKAGLRGRPARFEAEPGPTRYLLVPPDAPDKSVDVDCGSQFQTLDEDTATHTGAFNHSRHIGDPVFAQDLCETLHGDVDRRRIKTRKTDRDGRLHLTKV